MYRRFFCLVLMLFMLCGCRQEAPRETEALCNYVTRVDMTCSSGGQMLYKQYTQDEKIESVLYYLRLLENDGDLQMLPRNATGADFEILLFFSDGGCRSYRQKGAAYLSQDGGPWKILKQRQGRKLMTLFKLLPSDV